MRQRRLIPGSLSLAGTWKKITLQKKNSKCTNDTLVVAMVFILAHKVHNTTSRYFYSHVN
jgi:hypothetical protein